MSPNSHIGVTQSMHLRGFNRMLYLQIIRKMVHKSARQSLLFLELAVKSSRKSKLIHARSIKTYDMAWYNVALMFFKPKGMTWYVNVSHGVVNAVLY